MHSTKQLCVYKFNAFLLVGLRQKVFVKKIDLVFITKHEYIAVSCQEFGTIDF